MDDLVLDGQSGWGVVKAPEGEKGRTSELRLLVSVPGASCLSRRIVDVPSLAASWRAIARPTTPAPMTCYSLVWLPAGVGGKAYRVSDISSGCTRAGEAPA